MPLPISSSPPRFVANAVSTSVPDLLVDQSRMNIFNVTQSSSSPTVSVPLSPPQCQDLAFHVYPPLQAQCPVPYQTAMPSIIETVSPDIFTEDELVKIDEAVNPTGSASLWLNNVLDIMIASSDVFSEDKLAQIKEAVNSEEGAASLLLKDALDIIIASPEPQRCAILSLDLQQLEGSGASMPVPLVPPQGTAFSMPIHSKKGSQRGTPYSLPSPSSSSDLSNNADLGMTSQAINLKFIQLLSCEGKYYVEFSLPQTSMQKIEMQSVSLQPGSLDVTSKVDVYRQQRRMFLVISESHIITEGKYVFNVMVSFIEVCSITRRKTVRTETLVCEFNYAKINVKPYSKNPLYCNAQPFTNIKQ